MPTTLAHLQADVGTFDAESSRVVVACPDSRPPAYQAAAALAREGRLDRLVTGYYNRGERTTWPALDRKLARRRDPQIPASRVRSYPSFDLALALENHAGGRLRHGIARWRTRRFDRQLRGELRRDRPAALVAFSDVASEFTLPFCKDAGVSTILSMVHGDVREEVEVLDRERERSPDFFRIYLGDGPIDRRELGWLHDRRLHDLEHADRVLVPSGHIRDRLISHGSDPDRIDVVPYAADTRRFRPRSDHRHGATCRFVFAGGITQRKGISDLLDAWRLVRRPSWSLGLLGAMPRDLGPLSPYRDEFDWLGRVGHAEMPAILADSDVFVFPSLFEGSAVVTYEALACGLPSIVTAESGSVARHGLDGLIVPAADPVALAAAMERLGSDPALREVMSRSARDRAEAFDWVRYHRSIIASITRAIGDRDRRTDHASGFATN